MGRKICKSAFVFIAEAEESRQVRINYVVRLRRNEVAVRKRIGSLRIDAAKIQDRLPAGAESVCAMDGDRESQVIGTEHERIKGNTGRRRVFKL